MRQKSIFIQTMFIISLLGTACLSPAVKPTISPTMSQSPTPPLLEEHPEELTQELPVELAWFYKPPSDGNLAYIASQFDLFILTKADEDERDQLIELGVRQPILQYLLLNAIHDPGSCTAKPRRNQVAYLPGDFCRINNEHPGWFLRDRNGQKIYRSNNNIVYYMMDPGNPGWREFWLERARKSQVEDGWQGVFLDNVEASLDKIDRTAGFPATYKTDLAYQNAISGFLDYIYRSYFQPQNRPLLANIIELKDIETWDTYLRSLDGAMLENFAVSWKGKDFSQSQWEEHLKLAELTQAQGKQMVLIAQGDRDDLARQQFAFASYLLASSGLASFRYASSDHYDEAWIYDNYDIELGPPLNSPYQEGNIWRRDFQNGTIMINLTTRSAEIKLK
jgi:hypothetical protein